MSFPPVSILDLAPVALGSTPGDALRNSRDLARHAERWGYNRYWLAEHHNMIGIASAATAVAIGYIAGGTERIRVGSGGIMLPNHAPIVIAEQFGTLASLYPGRIDLGVGRAPGTDQLTLRALRRSPEAADAFPRDVLELQALLGDLQPGQAVQAVPGTGTKVPLWILGSSLFGAQLAAMLGLPFAFASHFAPDALQPALEIYRARFEPSEQLQRPHAMVGLQRDRGRNGCGGATAVHLAAAEFRQPAARNPRPAPPADRRHRSLLVPRREGAGLADARLFVRRIGGDGVGRPERVRCRDRRGRTDRRFGDLRSCGEIALV